MNLFISIFGGMLLTALLYGAARLVKLSNFWAAVAAAGLPSAAYLFYAFYNWSGLDVVTMHVVAYPTVALLLYVLYESRPGKELHVHWVPQLLIGFFLLLTLVLGGFVYIAGHGLPPALAERLLPNAKGKTLYTGFAGVVEHGEDAAKSIAQQRNIEARLAKMGWNVEVIGLDGLAREHSSEVSVRLRKSDGSGVNGQDVRFALSRPGQAAPTGQLMREVGSGDYRTRGVLPAAGVWLATISFAAEGKNIVLEHAVGHE
ncbi:MAG: FixH family protein [Pseudomonadota bacterium]|nr:FixH family protein [Pseudomonadota bacterium]